MHRVARARPSQTALRTRASPGGQSAQSRHARSPNAGLAAAVAQRSAAPAASGTGRARRPARRPRGPAPAPRTGGSAAGSSHRSSLERRAARARSAKRGIDGGPHDLDRRASTPGNQHRSAAAPCATSIARPSAARRPAARIARTQASRPGGTPCREPTHSVRDGRCSSGSGSPGTRPSGVVLITTVHSRRRRASRRRGLAPILEAARAAPPIGTATATAAPRSRAAHHGRPRAAAGPDDQPRPAGGVQLLERREQCPATSVLSPTDRSVLAPEGVARPEHARRLLERPIHRPRRRLLVRDGDVAARRPARPARRMQRRDDPRAAQRRARTPRADPRARKAAFCMAGESECATGSPRMAKTRVVPSITAPCRRPGSPRLPMSSCSSAKVAR